jgi:hypothetical protein
MRGGARRERAALAAALAVASFGVPAAFGAVQRETAAAVAHPRGMSAARLLDGATDVRLRFVPEGGPSSVRVELAPDARSLTLLEARAVAQQGFLAALNEPGLGGGLKSVVVTVDLVPGNRDPALKRSFLYFATGRTTWSVLSAD